MDKIENRSKLTPDDVLTEEEFTALIRVANVQDRARFAICLDKTGRHGEVNNLRKRDIQTTEWGYNVTYDMAGSGARTIPMARHNII